MPPLVPSPEADAYTLAVASVRAGIVRYAQAAWALAGVDDESMAALVARIVPAVLAAQMQVANLTAVFLGQAAGGRPAPVVRELVTGGRRLDPVRVYQRPVITARTALAQSKSFDEAKTVGGHRLESLVTTDLQLAKTRQADRSLIASGAEFYRRVPKGESTCALCLIAATQPYTVGELLPIHPGCDCGVEALPPGVNLDDQLDADRLLEATHAKVEEFTGVSDRAGRAPDYRKLLITHEHGELGPVLGWRGEQFTGPRGLPTPPESDADVARRLLPGLRDSLANLRSQGLSDDSPQITYHKQQIDRLWSTLSAAEAA